MKILFGDFKVMLGREGAFRPTIGNESLHEINIDNEVKAVNFATPKKYNFHEYNVLISQHS
jgi:hypothetical protein